MPECDDVALIDDLQRRGITPGNLASMAVTICSAVAIVVGGAWTARGVLDGVQQSIAAVAATQRTDEEKLKQVDDARQQTDRALFDSIRALNGRIDNLFDGKRGALPTPDQTPGNG